MNIPLPYYQEFQSFVGSKFQELGQSHIFQHLGVLITFLYSMTPSFIPIPTEILMAFLINAVSESARFSYAMFLIGITTAGAIISDLLFLYGGRHLHKANVITKLFHIKLTKKAELKESSKFHKYGTVLFLATPSMSLIFLGANELLLIFSGHSRAKISRILPAIIAGELIRGYGIGYVILHGMGII